MNECHSGDMGIQVKSEKWIPACTGMTIANQAKLGDGFWDTAVYKEWNKR